MNRKKVVEFLNSLEQKYPVDSWRVADVDVWPILKVQTFFFWFEKTEAKKKEHKTTKKKGQTTGVKSIFGSLFSWMRFLLFQVAKSKYLFSGAYSYRVKFLSASLNRYFDPIMDHLEDQEETGILQFEQNNLKDDDAYRRDRIVELRRLFPLANVIVKLGAGRRVPREISFLKDFNACLKEIESAIPEITNSFLKRQIIYMVQTILAWAFVFDRIFNRVKPRYAFGLCYYTLQMQGMNVSARRKGVISVDMQHGTQGDLHVAYANLFRVPKQGFTVLPQYFWCWDKASADVISRWSVNQHFHKVIVGGNPWINFLARQDQEIPTIPTSKKMVLYTLQPVEPIIDDYILEAISKMSGEFEWWLRLHPRQLKEKDRLTKILQDANVLNCVNIDEACRLPLPTLLQHAAVHLSKFSGSIIEAGLMGVPNVVIDEIGAEAFKSELSQGIATAFLDKDADKMVALLLKLSNQSCKALENVNFADTIKTHFNSFDEV